MKLVGYYNYTVIATYLGLAAAAGGIIAAFSGNTAVAVYCLFFSGVVDTFDGKIARTRRRSREEKLFGIEIDSLCDLVSFGVLPAVTGLSMGVGGAIGAAVCCAYILCALIRLAYYNVDEVCRQEREPGGRTTYEGLPVTSAALIFPLLYALRGQLGESVSSAYTVILALTTAAFVTRFRLKKPGMAGIFIFIAIGLVELLMIILL